MKQFCCGDVVPGCTAKFTYQTHEQIFEAVAAHASQAHGIVQITPELVSMVSARIHDLPSV